MILSGKKYFSRNLHILIWLIVLAIPTIAFWGQASEELTQWFYFISSLYNIAFFYFNAYFLYPKLLNRNFWWLYVPALAVTIWFSFRLKLLLLRMMTEAELQPQQIRIIFFTILPFVIASIIYRLVHDRLRFERLEKEARAERASTELKYLRSQVSPHFLFNMMTNMVALARVKSDELESALIQLSELLRYMLYESGSDRIRLNREIENLKNYIALQQLRFSEDVHVEVNFSEDYPDILVEPMLLIPFIENAFKHGVGLLKDPYIQVKLVVSGHILQFSVINNFNKDNQSKDQQPGIGLANVKNRLALLYPGRHNLVITNDNQLFAVNLNIEML